MHKAHGDLCPRAFESEVSQDSVDEKFNMNVSDLNVRQDDPISPRRLPPVTGFSKTGKLLNMDVIDEDVALLPPTILCFRSTTACERSPRQILPTIVLCIRHHLIEHTAYMTLLQDRI